MAELFDNDNNLVKELKNLKKKIVLDDKMDADKQGTLLSQILNMIRIAEMTDEEYKSQYCYPHY